MRLDISASLQLQASAWYVHFCHVHLYYKIPFLQCPGLLSGEMCFTLESEQPFYSEQCFYSFLWRCKYLLLKTACRTPLFFLQMHCINVFLYYLLLFFLTVFVMSVHFGLKLSFFFYYHLDHCSTCTDWIRVSAEWLNVTICYITLTFTICFVHRAGFSIWSIYSWWTCCIFFQIQSWFM